MMKYIKLYLFACIVLIGCSKDEITTRSINLDVESISGTVFVDSIAADQEFTIYLLELTISQDPPGITADTIATTITSNGVYLFDQIIPSDEEYIISLDLPDIYSIYGALDESPDGDPHDFGGIGRNIGVVLESNEADADNNFYIGTQVEPCFNKLSGYVYIIDADGVQTPSAFMDIFIVEREANGNPIPIIFEQVETDAQGYYELILNGEFELAVIPSIVDYPFPFTALDTVIAIDETPDDDPIINAADGYVDVDIDSCEVDDQNNFYFYLGIPAQEISGNVLLDENNDGQTDRGLRHARVSLFNRDAQGNPTGQKIDHVFTDIDGGFKFNSIPNGEYVLVLRQNELYNITSSSDENMEAGEPFNPIGNYISVNINDGMGDDLNYFKLEYHLECDINFTILPYWALCDTSIICDLDEIPLIVTDQYFNPLILLSGEVAMAWTNLRTGDTSNSDVAIWNMHDAFHVEITLNNGCVYDAYYNRECADDFEGALSMMQINVGGVDLYEYMEGDIVWTINPIESEITIVYNIAQPTAFQSLDAGTYDYQIKENGTLEIIDGNGVSLNLGEIGYDGNRLYLNDTVDGDRREFVKL